MCRFKPGPDAGVENAFAFQYILCVGSSKDVGYLVSGEKRFNTSYVSVQVGQRCFTKRLKILSFNTSYVSVQVELLYLAPSAITFQYILCVGSRCKGTLSSVQSSLFQYILCVGSSYITQANKKGKQVSIHPMCRFKCNCYCFISSFNLVSIHPMCRFK